MQKKMIFLWISFLFLGVILYFFFTETGKHVRFKKKHPSAQVPAYASQGAAGCDLHACLPNRSSVVLKSRQTTVVGTGIVVAVPDGMEMQIRSRSGLTLKGIVVANSPGTIDSDYRGEIKILLLNRTKRNLVITDGMRIAQGVFAKVTQVKFFPCSVLSETKRGTDGFGSTGLERLD